MLTNKQAKQLLRDKQGKDKPAIPMQSIANVIAWIFSGILFAVGLYFLLMTRHAPISKVMVYPIVGAILLGSAFIGLILLDNRKE